MLCFEQFGEGDGADDWGDVGGDSSGGFGGSSGGGGGGGFTANPTSAGDEEESWD